jgi:hypothetical protein
VNLPFYFRPNPKYPQLLGLDMSQAQAKVPEHFDFAKLLAYADPRINFLWLRSGISWGYADPLFPYFRAMAEAFALPWASYHVFYPTQPIVRQLDNWSRILGDDPGDGPHALDIELKMGTTRSEMTRATDLAVDSAARRFERTMTIYSRPYFIRDCFVPGADFFDNVWWWLTCWWFSGVERNPLDIYKVLAERTMLPVGIPRNRVIAVQTTKMGQARTFGSARSHALDYDRWVAPLSQFNALWRGAP